jgi:hypothetical protein
MENAALIKKFSLAEGVAKSTWPYGSRLLMLITVFFSWNHKEKFHLLQ